MSVILDEKLNWKAHRNYIKSKVSKSVGILYKVKDLFDYYLLHILYCSLILPYLGYCTDVWGNTYPSNSKPLFLLQKRAIRIINGKGIRALPAVCFSSLDSSNSRILLTEKYFWLYGKQNKEIYLKHYKLYLLIFLKMAIEDNTTLKLLMLALL